MSHAAVEDNAIEVQLSLTSNAFSIHSTAERTDTADKEITVTDTTVSVMPASQKTRSADVTTCAVLEWSVCLEFVKKLCRVEQRGQGARRIANAIQDCAA